MERKMEGKAGKGRSRTPFMKQIIENIGRTTYKKPKAAMMNRDEWMSIDIIEPI